VFKFISAARGGLSAMGFDATEIQKWLQQESVPIPQFEHPEFARKEPALEEVSLH